MNPIQSLLAGTRRGLGSLKVVMATGLYKTAAGVVGARLLKEHADALRAYLTIHLRSAKAAQNALAGIDDTIEHGSAEDLNRGPSKRAALYLAAKNTIEYERIFGDGTPNQPMTAVPWEPAPPGRPDRWGRGLDEMRFSLGPDEVELLELHYARGLELAELSYVIGIPKDEIQRRLEAGTGYAKILLEDVFGDAAPKLEEILRDAYAVIPPSPADLAATKKAVVPFPPGTVIGDRYEIDERIGGGEFAYVYRARDVRVPGHVVALKLLHRVARTPAARDGAIRELSLIASAFHPSLVQFKDHGWFEERLWFVMPFYPGEMLLSRLERGPLDLDEALAHFERLARGLAALHSAGIRHQDVKPENIFLVELATGATADRPEVLPVLLDLGVAAPSGEMALAGTPMYFPPEVAARIFDEELTIPLTPKADVFALALSLLHSIEEPDLSAIDGLEVDAFLKQRASSTPSGPRSRQLQFLRPYFDSWLAAHPNDRPSAGGLADQIGEIRNKRGGRRVLAAPRGLRSAIVALATTSLVAACVLLVDAPPRAVSIIEASEGAPPREPASETERITLLRHEIDTEQRRNAALEDELGRLRRRELGIDPPPEAADAGVEASTETSTEAAEPPAPARSRQRG